jgi:hypothetical protein
VRLGPITVFGRVTAATRGSVSATVRQPMDGVRPGPVRPALVDRTTNSLIVPAVRPVAAAWDGVCQFAVLANVPTAP